MNTVGVRAMTIQLIRRFSEDDLLQIFDERIAPLYARKTVRSVRSVLVNIAHRIPELVELSPHLNDRELKEEVVRAALDAGYSYSTMRGVAAALVRFIRKLSNENMDTTDYYDLVERFTSNYTGTYRRKLKSILESLYPKIPELVELREAGERELREAVKRAIMDTGHAENTARRYAGSVVRFIREELP